MTKAFKFGASSNAELATVHPELATMARRALELSAIDFKVLQGIRTAAEQLAAYKSGHSKIKSGGRHQFGCAIDVMAVDPKTGKGAWKPISLYTKIRQAFQAASKELGIPLRTLEKIGDYGHFELPKSYMPDNWKAKATVATLPPPQPKAVVKRAAEIARREVIRDVQRNLKTVGFYEVGEADGKLGDRTRGAISSYRASRDLPLSEEIDDALVEDLNKAITDGWKRPISKERAEKPRAEIAKKSGTMKVSWWGKLLAAVGLGGGAAGNTAKEFLSDPDRVDSHLTLLQRLGGFLSENFILVAGIVVAGIGVFTAFQIIEHLRVSAEREGRHFSE